MELTLLCDGTSWYRPRTMSRASHHSGKLVLFAAGCMMLSAGCGSGRFLQRDDPSKTLYSTKVSELQPGSYCEIEMVLPPTAAEGSSHCFKGTVKEVNHEEVVLTDVVEDTQIEYGSGGRRREPSEEKHPIVRVPLTGVDEIWSLRPQKNNAAPPHDSAAASTTPPKLPSAGAHPVMPAGESAHFE